MDDFDRLVLDTSHEPDELVSSPISETNPLTQEITAKNASSDLFRLPQEIKQLVYENILGGQLIHIFQDPKRPWSLTCYLCQAEHSEKEAERIFAASKEPWFSIDIASRHEVCYPSSIRNLLCLQCWRQHDIATKSYAQLSLAFLRCCRQMYQESRSIVFSNCTFSFMEPPDIDFFYDITGCQIMSDIRNLHLDIMIHSEKGEHWWSETLKRTISEIKSLQNIYINIDLHPADYQQFSKWKFKEPAERSFLEGLHSLIDLKLKTATVIISDHHISHLNCSSQREGAKRWTMSRKQVWAGYIKRVLLHQDAMEEVV